jgi:hypothetical protein
MLRASVCILLSLASSLAWAADEDQPTSAPRDVPHDRGFYHQQQEQQQRDKTSEPETDGESPSVAKECPDKLTPSPTAKSDKEDQKIEGPQSKACP